MYHWYHLCSLVPKSSARFLPFQLSCCAGCHSRFYYLHHPWTIIILNPSNSYTFIWHIWHLLSLIFMRFHISYICHEVCDVFWGMRTKPIWQNGCHLIIKHWFSINTTQLLENFLKLIEILVRILAYSRLVWLSQVM